MKSPYGKVSTMFSYHPRGPCSFTNFPVKCVLLSSLEQARESLVLHQFALVWVEICLDAALFEPLFEG